MVWVRNYPTYSKLETTHSVFQEMDSIEFALYWSSAQVFISELDIFIMPFSHTLSPDLQIDLIVMIRFGRAMSFLLWEQVSYPFPSRYMDKGEKNLQIHF